MNKLNEKNIQEIGIWSIRNIRKLFRRIYNQQLSEKNYKNIIPEIQILIFILGGIVPNKRNEIFCKIRDLIIECFSINKENVSLIDDLFNEKNEPKIEIFEEKKYLMKGKIGIILPPEFHHINEELPSFLNCLFFTLFVDFKECLLFCGPSGHKTFIAKKISSKDTPILNLYQETSISQLLGSVILTNNFKAKEFYLEEILKICYSTSKLKEFKQKLIALKNVILKDGVHKKELIENKSFIEENITNENSINEAENNFSSRRNRKKKKVQKK